MARYDHLPIWKDAVALATLLEEAVRRFPRYHKYALGSDLRRQAYVVCRGVVVANGEREIIGDRPRFISYADQKTVVSPL